MRKHSLGRMACLVVLAGAIPAFSVSAQAAEKWEWDITPYLWASSVSVDVSVDGDPVLGADASFSNLVDKVDLAGMLHFEGRRGKVGFFTEADFFSLTDEQTHSADSPLPGGTQTEANLDLGLYEAGGFHRLKDAVTGLDILYGIRVIDTSQDVTITLPSPISMTVENNSSDTYTDGILGVRYSHPMGKRWYFAIRGDIGGGGTEIAWNGVATFGFQCDQKGKYNLRFGYRYFKTELDSTQNDVDVESDVALFGPYLGFGFVF
jgi:hypothetical protein